MNKFEVLRPQAVLLDIGMPLMDGCSMARHLRKDPNGAGILLIAITGYGRDADRRLGRQAGFDEFLTKPVDLEELETILSRYRPEI